MEPPDLNLPVCERLLTEDVTKATTSTGRRHLRQRRIGCSRARSRRFTLGYDAGVQLEVAVVRIRGVRHWAVPTGHIDPFSGKNTYSTLCGCNRQPADEIDDTVGVDCMGCLVRSARLGGVLGET